MKKCPECGEVYDDSWKVCLRCSVNLSDDLSIKESDPGLRNIDGNRRPSGVTILGALIIIGAILGLASARDAWKYNPQISNYLYLIIVPLSIVAAVSLLKLKEWARLAIIAISIIASVETLVTAQHAMNMVKEYDMTMLRKSFYEGIERGQKNRKPGTPELTKQQVEDLEKKAMIFVEKGIRITMATLLILNYIFNCVVIFYFTRPKVKAHFS
jgi:hypothetical protein